MMSWHFVTAAEFAAGVKVDGDMYYLKDTHEIYRGTQSYSHAVELYETTLPTSPAKNRLYIEKATLAGKMWDGTIWYDVVKPVDSTVTVDGANPVSGAAVAAYVSAEIAKLASSAETVKNVEYDAEEHSMTVTMGDDSANTFFLDGLGCSLSFANNELQLLDASGNKIGAAVNMDIERFVHGGEYDEATQSIILYFDAEHTDSVTIPVGDLVDTYTVEGSAAIDLQMVANKITAALVLSPDEGNAAEIRENGLYVPAAEKVDVSGLMPKVEGAVEGNLPAFAADGTVVDSGVSAIAAGKHTVYHGASIVEAATVAPNAVDGDYFIVENVIYDGDEDKISRMAYVYSNSAWQALDGNVNAENVYFAEDLMTTANIGVIKTTNGQATIAAAGKNLKQVLTTIMVEKKNPSATQPSVTVSTPKATALEVGSTYTPSYTATLNAGSYTYGPATGVTATSWAISDSYGHTATANAGSFDSFTVGDEHTGTDGYRVTATATYGDGAIPVTNTGEEYATAQIKGGSKTGYSGYITGYRATFYGSHTTKDAIDSTMVRKLAGKSEAALAAGSTFEFTVPAGAMRIVVAYPASIRDWTEVKNKSNNFDEKTAFTQHIVDVEGANGYTAASYKVYVLDRAEAVATAFTYAVTL